MAEVKKLQLSESQGIDHTMPLTQSYYIHLFNSFEVKEFVCGWSAAFINITVTYPIYKIIFRQVNYYLIL